MPSTLRSLERPQVLRRVLPNGLTILAPRDPSHPLVAFHAVVRTGSATEGEHLGAGVYRVTAEKRA